MDFLKVNLFSKSIMIQMLLGFFSDLKDMYLTENFINHWNDIQSWWFSYIAKKKKDYRNECSKISARSAPDVHGFWHEESLMRAFYYTPSTLFKTWRIWTILIRTLAEATWDAFLPTFTHGLNKIAYQDKTNSWCVFIFLFLLRKIITCKIMFNWNDCMLKV